jgi:hypothetical protein
MMAEIIHMSQEFYVFSRDGGVGQGRPLSALPHISTVETFHDSPSVFRPRFLRMDSPLSSIRYEL